MLREKEKEQIMAKPNEINPGIRDAAIEEIDGGGPEGKIRQLTRRLPEARGSSRPDQAAKPELKVPGRTIASPRQRHRPNRPTPPRQPLP